MKVTTKSLLLVGLAILVGTTVSAQSNKPMSKAGTAILEPDDYVPKSAVIFEGKWESVNEKYEDDGSIAWIRCDTTEMECIQLDGSTVTNRVLLWQTSYRIKSWEGSAIIAEGFSLDGCTRAMLVADVKAETLEVINSPVTPYPDRCARFDSNMEKLGVNRKDEMKEQTKQDHLVPTQFPGSGDAPLPKPPGK